MTTEEPQSDPEVYQNSLRKGKGTYSLQQVLTIGQIAVTA